LGPCGTIAALADPDRTASDQPETLMADVIDENDVLCAFLTTRVGFTLRPPCPLDMGRHRLVRVHDAAGKEFIYERIVRLEPFNTFRGIFDALELDRPLLEV
jgi:hypothetical protein